MKRIFMLLITLMLCVSIACANDDTEIKLSNEGEISDMKILIKLTSDTGTHEITATLEENSSAVAFYELIKKELLTIKLSEYGNFEKVGSIGTTLPRNDTRLTTKAGDIMLYQGNQVTIFYNSNSWNYTRLGKIDGVTQLELKNILGKGDVTAIFEIID